MNEKADIILNILNEILNSNDIDQAILELNDIIAKVSSQTTPQRCEPYRHPSAQVLQLH